MAAFILSFDCEGRWGWDPFGSAAPHISTALLDDRYERLLALLDHRKIPASFAFVGAHTLSADEARANPKWFEPLQHRGKNWYATFQRALAMNEGDGWLAPRAFMKVVASGAHEIATQGFSHIPLYPGSISETGFDHEMDKVRHVAALKGVSFNTIVYPRNQVGYTERLSEQGIHAFRPPRSAEIGRGSSARLVRLLGEFRIREQSQSLGAPGLCARLPEARYINYRHGLRRLVPFDVTVAKMTHVIDDAIRRNRVVHLYTHPEDFILGNRQFDLLDSILDIVQQRARGGEMEPMTQINYCRRFLRHPDSL